MGTRHIIAVQLDGKYRIAQYGQWDGYPAGQGISCLNFLTKEMNEDIFKTALRNSYFIHDKALEAVYEKYGGSAGFISLEDAKRLKADYPTLSRDTGADILRIVQSHPDGIALQNSIAFVGDGLFCEWVWVIDLDHRTFEGYKGFNQTPLKKEDRFFGIAGVEGYEPACIVASFSLDDLPSDEEFLRIMKE